MTSRLLNDGVRVPNIAFGTATAHYQKECSASILLALQKGFLHIDTAHGYGNEESVKQALNEWGGKREDVFICSKWGWSEPDHTHDPEVELRESLDKMGLGYLDLYLKHVPNPKGFTNAEAWKKMEEFRKKGLVRSIGVSSFKAEHIEELATIWTIKPSVNQIEYHPYCYHDHRMVQMASTCSRYDIAISPFTSLAPITHFKGGPLDPILKSIGDKKGITPAQILLAWARQRTGGGPVVTTASKEWQYQQILDSVHIVLNEDDISGISGAGERGGVKGIWTIPGWDEPDH